MSAAPLAKPSFSLLPSPLFSSFLLPFLFSALDRSPSTSANRERDVAQCVQHARSSMQMQCVRHQLIRVIDDRLWHDRDHWTKNGILYAKRNILQSVQLAGIYFQWKSEISSRLPLCQNHECAILQFWVIAIWKFNLLRLLHKINIYHFCELISQVDVIYYCYRISIFGIKSLYIAGGENDISQIGAFPHSWFWL